MAIPSSATKPIGLISPSGPSSSVALHVLCLADRCRLLKLVLLLFERCREWFFASNEISGSGMFVGVAVTGGDRGR
jgi:hypothetical protein